MYTFHSLPTPSATQLPTDTHRATNEIYLQLTKFFASKPHLIIQRFKSENEEWIELVKNLNTFSPTALNPQQWKTVRKIIKFKGILIVCLNGL